MMKATALHPTPKPKPHTQRLDKHLHAKVFGVCRLLAIDTKITNPRLQWHQLEEDPDAASNGAVIDALIIVLTTQAANNVRQEALAR